MVRAKCAPQFMRHVHRADARLAAAQLRDALSRAARSTAASRPDGKLTPCPYLPASAGDLRRAVVRRDLGATSPLFQRCAHGALGGKCGRCEYRALCGGCRARAFALEGDLLAADPSCAYEPTGDAPLDRAAARRHLRRRRSRAALRVDARTREARLRAHPVVRARRGRASGSRTSRASAGRDEVTAELMGEVRERDAGRFLEAAARSSLRG